jgi:thiamine pyrophosphate-dependent acetolactate synthase large subunit-like protein
MPAVTASLASLVPEARELAEIPVPGALAHDLARPAAPRSLDGPVLDVDGRRAVVLAGPGVLRDDAIDGLHALAARLGAPVANSWGAKGVFPWDSPHHMGTVGLQAQDFPLLALDRFDLLVTTGVDPDETPPERYAAGAPPAVDVAPAQLEAVADRARGVAVATDAGNDLYTRVAGVAQPGYVDESFPRHPARAVMDLKQSIEPGTIVTAQPGPAGLWVARTFPTDFPGSVVVPARSSPGVGAACALAVARHGRRAVCVAVDPVDDVTARLATVAESEGLPFRLEVWGDEVEWDATATLVAAAGPVVAWAV